MLKSIATVGERSRRIHRRIGPYSTEGALSTLDGRSREALYMKRLRRDLIAHVGTPSAVQRELIERVVRLSLQLQLMDEKLTHGIIFKTRDHNHYLAWSNALTRTLSRLGIADATLTTVSRGNTLENITKGIIDRRRKGAK